MLSNRKSSLRPVLLAFLVALTPLFGVSAAFATDWGEWSYCQGDPGSWDGTPGLQSRAGVSALYYPEYGVAKLETHYWAMCSHGNGPYNPILANTLSAHVDAYTEYYYCGTSGWVNNPYVSAPWRLTVTSGCTGYMDQQSVGQAYHNSNDFYGPEVDHWAYI